ncbi:SDR family NAD(P)-dependent oxidoreductase [Streptomyces rectiverticillatus]|uniref:SDR family NAD(P)-dependent oxidoreductase n=1 Tax=Streptomyces rectiverticillatus TaxID=173860 RepID=UPI0015C2C37E|nr:SDR family NAD(P)-dependent oxidoreductase [Streptomyces rectiverticillatus]QLE75685.1 SDR family NAD(P)-dependent oxidoreductase [Streptomyces rectiverticillatus]
MVVEVEGGRWPAGLQGSPRRDAFGGGPDVLVNNAGVTQVGPVSAMAESDFRQAMETMYFAPLRLVLAALPGMRESGGGRIVNVSSIGGRVAAPHLLPYVGAKFAAAGLSEGLRAELAADGISVTSVFRLHRPAPATVTRCLTLGARLLPTAGRAPQHNVPGHKAACTARPRIIHRLTRLNDRAARRFNQQVS